MAEPVSRSDMLNRARNAIRRKSLLRFVRDSMLGYQAGWVHHIICDKLERFFEDVRAKKSPRLMFQLPPRHGKSFIASERFPAWSIGKIPDIEVVCCSYAAGLASDFSRRSLNLVEDDYYRQIFTGFRFDPRKKTLKHWLRKEGGGYRTAGVDGTITGAGANVLVIDDPVKNWREALSESSREGVWNWYTSTAYTRLAPGGGVLLIQTRWHKDDLAGRLIAEMAEGGDQWDVLTFPAVAEKDSEYRKAGEALHPERYDIERLKKIEKAVGRKVWVSLYQQKPADAEGNEFRRDDFKYYGSPPEVFRVIISVDAALKDLDTSDQVSIQVWGDANPDFYLLHDLTDQMDIFKTCDAIKSVYKLYPETSRILIEDKANGPAIIKMLEREYGEELIVAVEPLGGKVSRARAVAPAAEQGHIHLPLHQAFMKLWLEEICEFPFGKYDDRVDAFTQAVNWMLGNDEDGDYVTSFTQKTFSRR